MSKRTTTSTLPKAGSAPYARVIGRNPTTMLEPGEKTILANDDNLTKLVYAGDVEVVELLDSLPPDTDDGEHGADSDQPGGTEQAATQPGGSGGAGDDPLRTKDS